MNKRRRKGKQRQPSQDSPPPATEPDQSQAAAGTPTGGERQDGSSKPIRPRGTWADWGSVIVQAIAAVILFYYTMYSYNMWQAMEASNKLAQGSSETTKKVVEANQILAEAARVSAVQSKRLADAAQAANELAVRGTASASKNAASAAALEEHLFRLAHRARLGYVQIDSVTLQPGTKYEIKINYRNDPASTTALDVQVAAVGEIRNSPPPKYFAFSPSPFGERAKLTVGPGGGAFVPIIWGPIEGTLIDAVNAGKMRAYIYGRITYTDEFQTAGMLEFCFYYYPSQHDWRFCIDHNTSD